MRAYEPPGRICICKGVVCMCGRAPPSLLSFSRAFLIFAFSSFSSFSHFFESRCSCLAVNLSWLRAAVGTACNGVCEPTDKARR